MEHIRSLLKHLQIYFKRKVFLFIIRNEYFMICKERDSLLHFIQNIMQESNSMKVQHTRDVEYHESNFFLTGINLGQLLIKFVVSSFVDDTFINELPRICSLAPINDAIIAIERFPARFYSLRDRGIGYTANASWWWAWSMLQTENHKLRGTKSHGSFAQWQMLIPKYQPLFVRDLSIIIIIAKYWIVCPYFSYNLSSMFPSWNFSFFPFLWKKNWHIVKFVS